MTFAWPWVLLSLLVVPALLAWYAAMLRQRRRSAISYSNVALLRQAAPRRAGWRRHLPVALILGALAALGIAGARPQVSTQVPVSASTVIMAVDVSGSMCATDIAPNRLSAAQAAVRRFVENQAAGTKIGIVLFSGFAQLAVPPTEDREALLATVDTLTTGRGTTIGSAILKSVDAISEVNADVAPSDAEVAAPPADGEYAPEIVVLLTDGANTRGVTPVEAAQVAKARGVRVYPIGFGTTSPTSMSCTVEQLGGNGFDGFGGPGGGFGRGGGGGPGGLRAALVVDEPTLRQVADITGGGYFAAADADQLDAVLTDLPKHVKLQQEEVEVSAGFAALAALLLLLGLAAAIRWAPMPG